MRLAATPHAAVNQPPATRSPFSSVRSTATVPSIPEASADQLAPLQRAMFLVGTPPASEKRPPATRSPFGSVAIVLTIAVDGSVLIPVPRADQLVPFQRAMHLELT